MTKQLVQSAEAAAVPGPSAQNTGRPLGSRAANGAVWAIAGYAATRTARLASNLLLAMLLFPEAFGVMALVIVLIQGLNLLSDVGLRDSVIFHERGDDPRFLNTAWTIQIIRGFVLCGLACVLAWPMSLLYDASLAFLMPVAALVAVFRGFNSTAVFSANRRLHVRGLAILHIASTTTAIVVMIVWAYLSPTVWAMVGGSVAESVFYLIGSHVFLEHRRHRLCWDRSSRQSMFHFGKWIILSSATHFLAMRMDRLLLGTLVTLATLGVYSIALGLAAIPRVLIDRIGSMVLQPAFAETGRDDPTRFVERFMRAREIVLATGMLAVLAVVIISPMFFEALYDERYTDAAWIAQLVAIGVWVRVLDVPPAKALIARGSARAFSFTKVVHAVASIVGSIVGYVKAGVPGFILGNVCGSVAGHLVTIRVVRQLGLYIARSDARYCAIFAVGAAIAAGGPSLLSSTSGSLLQAQLICGTLAIAVVVACTFATWRRILALVRNRRRLPGSRPESEEATVFTN